MRHDISPTRRMALGGLLASALTPRLAFAQTERGVKMRIIFNRASMVATLYDNPSARGLASMLPLALSIDDYSNNEKIAYLPRKLTDEGRGPFGNEAPGDLCYYEPWGNLVFFYASYRYSAGLIRLGRIDRDFAPLLVRGKFDLQIELV